MLMEPATAVGDGVPGPADMPGPATDFESIIDRQSATAQEAHDAQNALLQNWIPQTLADARKPRPPLQWIVWNLLPRNSLSIFFGAPGHLKSMILLDLACCVAAGRPWMETMPNQPDSGSSLPTTAGPVLWVDFDNGERITSERVQAFADAYELTDDTPLHYLTMPTPFLDSSKPGMIAELIRYIEKGSYTLVIVDNLGLVKGAVEENSAEMTEVMKYLRLVAERTGAAVVLVHHQRKASTGGNGAVNEPRKGESLRGHSSIEAACDLVVHVHRQEGSDHVTLTPTKSRGGLPFPSLSAIFTYDNDPATNALIRGRFFGWSQQKPVDAWLKQIMSTIRDVAKANVGIGIEAAIREVQERMSLMQGIKQPGQKMVRALIKQMADEGDIELRSGPKVGEHSEKKLYPQGSVVWDETE